MSSCIFEYVYFARPDSCIDKVSVYAARLNMGRKLGQKIAREWEDLDVDVVIPIPETSCDVALEIAHTLDLPYRQGFVKNRYIGRTFIMPGQTQRKKSVRRKLNAISSEFKGKKVLLVDDSIVRGTTSEQIIQMAREAGAAKVYFASAAPEIRFPNVYGIDMPTANELIAHGREVVQAAAALSASGREMRMQVPLPLGPENAQMRPPWASIIAREMARPSPVPRLPQSPTGWV